MSNLKLERDGPGSYYVVERDVQVEMPTDGRIGTIVLTGSRRDNYPWEWMLIMPIKGKSCGVADTRHSALDQIRAAWAKR